MSNYKFHKNLGQSLKGIYTLIIFIILYKFFGTSIINDVILGFISYFVSYPLTGLTLRLLGIWTKN